MYNYINENFGIVEWFYLLLLLLPLVFAYYWAREAMKSQKKNPFVYQFSEVKNKAIKIKNNRSFFNHFFFNLFVIYFLYFIIFCGFYIFVFFGDLVNKYNLNFKTIFWDFFGSIFNFFGVAFIFILSFTIPWVFFVGILPNTLDKILPYSKITKFFTGNRKIKKKK